MSGSRTSPPNGGKRAALDQLGDRLRGSLAAASGLPAALSHVPAGARVALLALGTVDGFRIKKPPDPVAAWLLRRHPDLIPEEAPVDVVTSLRTRTALVDRMIEEEVERARQDGASLCLWTIGGAFDARWCRSTPLHGDVVVEHREVDHPTVLAIKARLLSDSPYDVRWAQVVQRPLPVSRWSVADRVSARPLVVMEGLADRIGPDELRFALQRVRFDAPDAVVLVEPPPAGWGGRGAADLGWVVLEDVRLAKRPALVASTGVEVCPGIREVRVQRLMARMRGR